MFIWFLFSFYNHDVPQGHDIDDRTSPSLPTRDGGEQMRQENGPRDGRCCLLGNKFFIFVRLFLLLINILLHT
jgi:hypothetical protein